MKKIEQITENLAKTLVGVFCTSVLRVKLSLNYQINFIINFFIFSHFNKGLITKDCLYK